MSLQASDIGHRFAMTGLPTVFRRVVTVFCNRLAKKVTDHGGGGMKHFVSETVAKGGKMRYNEEKQGVHCNEAERKLKPM